MLGIIGALCVALAAWAAGCTVTPRTPLPHVIRFTTGAAVLSLCIFALLALHAGHLGVYVALFVIFAAAAWKLRPTYVARLPRVSWFIVAAGAIVTAVYLIFALAPETQPDAVSYHLRLTRDYVNLHTFTSRVEFFDVMPQGIEMLFAPAVAIGGYTAAKILHLLFLLATIPLIRHIARELNLPNYTGLVAAALFFLSPVAAIDGTSAYVDVALVCACAATFYLLMRWDKERSTSLLFCAALNAGFCYTIKQTFGLVIAAALFFVIIRSRRLNTCLVFTATAAAVILPWTIRAWIAAGSPVAPFFTRWLPNKACSPEIERALAQAYSVANPQFSWARAFPEYTVLGGHQGLLGVGFLLLPLSLLALRKPAGRRLLTAAFILALPALANSGARFLMPSMLLAALALAMALPMRIAVVIAVVQLVFAVPQAMDLVQQSGDWRLREIPWRAALGYETEEHYLSRKLRELPVGFMVDERTPPGARILNFTAVSDAYTARAASTYWHSVKGQQLREALDFSLAALTNPPALYSAMLPGDARSLRASSPFEIRLLGINIGHTSMGHDAWRPQPAGTPLEYEVAPQANTADLLIWPPDAPLRLQVKNKEGSWLNLPATSHPTAVDTRSGVTAYVHRNGFGYILMSDADAFGPLCRAMLADPDKWGVRHIGETGAAHLFRILD